MNAACDSFASIALSKIKPIMNIWSAACPFNWQKKYYIKYLHVLHYICLSFLIFVHLYVQSPLKLEGKLKQNWICCPSSFFPHLVRVVQICAVYFVKYSASWSAIKLEFLTPINERCFLKRSSTFWRAIWLPYRGDISASRFSSSKQRFLISFLVRIRLTVQIL